MAAAADWRQSLINSPFKVFNKELTCFLFREILCSKVQEKCNTRRQTDRLLANHTGQQHPRKLINPPENCTGCLDRCIMGKLYGHIHPGYSQDPAILKTGNNKDPIFQARIGVKWLFSGHQNAIGKRSAVFFFGPDCCHLALTWWLHTGQFQKRRTGSDRKIRYVSVPHRGICNTGKATASVEADQSI